MKTIPLSQGKVALVDDADYEALSRFRWHYHTGYAARYDKYTGKIIKMHRVISSIPAGLKLDHEDGNGLNNQRDNLRVCNSTQNNRNRSINKNNSSGFKGVTFKKSRGNWVANIGVNRKQIHLGSFDSPIKAAMAYDSAAIHLFREYARTNKMLGVYV